MTPDERDSRLILQGVLLTLAAIGAVIVAGGMMAMARGAVVKPWICLVVVLSQLSLMYAARRWCIPTQRIVLRWNLLVLSAVVASSGIAAMAIWCWR